jgi:hypothetical protein
MKVTPKKHKRRSGFFRGIDFVLEIVFGGLLEFLAAFL